MTEDDALEEFRAAGALLKGHFILSSGRHSDTYFNKSMVGVDPARVIRLGRGMVEKAKAELGEAPTHVLAPVLGAIVFGYEVARQMERPFMFLERDGDGFALRRGFSVPKGAPCLVVEDVITTGGAAREAVLAVAKAGGRPLGVACLVDRSAGKADVGAPLLPLVSLDAPSYAPNEVPPELAAIAPVKPGSRS